MPRPRKAFRDQLGTQRRVGVDARKGVRDISRLGRIDKERRRAQLLFRAWNTRGHDRTAKREGLKRRKVFRAAPGCIGERDRISVNVDQVGA